MLESQRRGSSETLPAAVPLAALGWEGARAIFRLNTEIYPDAYNTWDSLGEACLELEDLAAAETYYRKSIELNFFNGNAHGMLRRIHAEP